MPQPPQIPPSDDEGRRTPSSIASLIEDRDLNVALVRLSSRLDAIDEYYRDLRNSLATQWKRMDDLNASITEKLDTSVSSINQKIEERGKPQWQAVITAIGLIGAGFFAFISPMQKQIDTIQNSQVQFAKDVNTEFIRRNDAFVTAREHVDLKNEVERNRNYTRDSDRVLDERIRRLEDRLVAHTEQDLQRREKDGNRM